MYDNYNISIAKKPTDVNIVLFFIAFLCDIILPVFFSTLRIMFLFYDVCNRETNQYTRAGGKKFSIMSPDPTRLHCALVRN